MKIEIIKHLNQTLSVGKKFDLEDNVAKDLIKKGIAKELKSKTKTKERKVKIKTKGKK